MKLALHWQCGRYNESQTSETHQLLFLLTTSKARRAATDAIPLHLGRSRPRLYFSAFNPNRVNEQRASFISVNLRSAQNCSVLLNIKRVSPETADELPKWKIIAAAGGEKRKSVSRNQPDCV